MVIIVYQKESKRINLSLTKRLPWSLLICTMCKMKLAAGSTDCHTSDVGHLLRNDSATRYQRPGFRRGRRIL